MFRRVQSYCSISSNSIDKCGVECRKSKVYWSYVDLPLVIQAWDNSLLANGLSGITETEFSCLEYFGVCQRMKGSSLSSAVLRKYQEVDY